MVLSVQASLIAVVVTTVLALLSKHLLKIKRKPIFNPAAFGLLIATSLFTSGQSWWCGLSMLTPFVLLLLLVCGFLITNRVNKFPQVLMFLGVYFLAFLVMGLLHIGNPADPLRPPFVNSALFMAFFRLTDPPTSPGTYKHQIIFSLLTSLISVGLYVLYGGLGYLLIGLLCGNAWNAYVSQKRSLKKSQKIKQPNQRKSVPTS
jgi:enediyne biosynthesis protein E5